MLRQRCPLFGSYAQCGERPVSDRRQTWSESGVSGRSSFWVLGSLVGRYWSNINFLYSIFIVCFGYLPQLQFVLTCCYCRNALLGSILCGGLSTVVQCRCPRLWHVADLRGKRHYPGVLFVCRAVNETWPSHGMREEVRHIFIVWCRTDPDYANFAHSPRSAGCWRIPGTTTSADMPRHHSVGIPGRRACSNCLRYRHGLSQKRTGLIDTSARRAGITTPTFRYSVPS
ncbi:hypothetical protein BU23DRAFT_278992 [Bimuria novae-zelandiae CBS 107.79]|uniref:Uncharacterized protein n=1 Tax=Bimuria novae-zelandiae CBS 107.79 TaxID=1447943 RepID=A0A6A5V412_9PLEO|nr:hypothetical protein BU23DRAFT_278992 [Bimuria novae-zelandiae CBS 107.79]